MMDTRYNSCSMLENTFCFGIFLAFCCVLDWHFELELVSTANIEFCSVGIFKIGISFLLPTKHGLNLYHWHVEVRAFPSLNTEH